MRTREEIVILVDETLALASDEQRESYNAHGYDARTMLIEAAKGDTVDMHGVRLGLCGVCKRNTITPILSVPSPMPTDGSEAIGVRSLIDLAYIAAIVAAGGEVGVGCLPELGDAEVVGWTSR